MDRTIEYRQLVKQYVSEQLKRAAELQTTTLTATQQLQHTERIQQLQLVDSTILTDNAQQPVQHTQFNIAADSIYRAIVYTIKYINKVKLSYLLVATPYSTRQTDGMTDQERNAFESYVTEFIRATNSKIDVLKQSIVPVDALEKDDESDQHMHDTVTYQHSVLKILYSNLQYIVEMFGNLRLQYTQQLKAQVIDLTQIDYNDTNISGAYSQTGRSELKSVWKSVTTGKYGKRTTPMNALRSKITATFDFNIQDDSYNQLLQQQQLDTIPEPEPPSVQFSEQEQLQYENENVLLLQSLETNLDSMKTAEKKLLEISEMLTMFATKIEQQSETIDMIESNVLDTNLNIETGIEHIKKAVAKSAQGTQFNIFVLLVMSFSLLFLDWFNS